LDLEFCGRNVLPLQSNEALLGIRRKSGNRFYGETPAMAMSVVLHHDGTQGASTVSAAEDW